ncbi:MAG: hypothetical protein GY906_36210 [bacterium]|nr:hypothetical protein [bacterium]
MVEDSKGCLKGCLIGCGVAVLLAVLLPIVGGVLMMGGFRQAMDGREELERRFGNEESYVPAPNGAIDADRIERFLTVREAVAETSSRLQDASHQMARMDQFDDQDDPPTMEILREAFKTTRAAMGIGSRMGEFFDSRNGALLAAEMNLGEYTYIYVMAYHDWLVSNEDGDELFDERPVNRRIRKLLISILENQLVVVLEDGVDTEAKEVLKEEIVQLEDYDAVLPWEAGLPEPITVSLAPYRQRLDELFWPASASLDLMRNKSMGGIGVETE